MTTWSKDELRKIAEADDLHISPFREDGMTYGTPTWIWSVAVDDALYVRIQRAELSLVPGRGAAESGADHCCRYDEGSHLRAGRRPDQRPCQRRLPGEVPWQPVSQPDDRRTCPLGDSQGHAARDQCLIVEHTP